MDRVRQIETLVQQIESAADPEMRTLVQELVEAILEFHGTGLERMLELTGEANPLLREFARDESVSGMLLLYGLHPDDFATRVRRAIDGIPNVELTHIEERRLRLHAIHGGVSRETIEQAIYAAAPETEGIEIEGLEPSASPLIPVDALFRSSATP